MERTPAEVNKGYINMTPNGLALIHRFCHVYQHTKAKKLKPGSKANRLPRLPTGERYVLLRLNLALVNIEDLPSEVKENLHQGGYVAIATASRGLDVKKNLYLQIYQPGWESGLRVVSESDYVQEPTLESGDSVLVTRDRDNHNELDLYVIN